MSSQIAYFRDRVASIEVELVGVKSNLSQLESLLSHLGIQLVPGCAQLVSQKRDEFLAREIEVEARLTEAKLNVEQEVRRLREEAERQQRREREEEERREREEQEAQRRQRVESRAMVIARSESGRLLNVKSGQFLSIADTLGTSEFGSSSVLHKTVCARGGHFFSISEKSLTFCYTDDELKLTASSICGQEVSHQRWEMIPCDGGFRLKSFRRVEGATLIYRKSNGRVSVKTESEMSSRNKENSVWNWIPA
jgi:hypothetical protein